MLWSADSLLGMAIFGITGALIGYYLASWPLIIAGILFGCILGTFVGRLGARRFFMSVIAGTILGGGLGWLAGGTEVIPVTAGTGSAVGGFVGINIELFMRARRARSKSDAQTESGRASPSQGGSNEFLRDRERG